MDLTRPDDPISIFISADEWRDITSWMHASLERNELSPQGHFLLECSGSKRIWVAGDGIQATVVHGEGLAPRGLDPATPFCVLVNSRFFRHRAPRDAILTVTSRDDGRVQTFETGGVDITLPEHPGDFCDWRAVLDGVNGIQVEVESTGLRDACSAASLVPFGVESDALVHAWICVRDGRLRLESPWIGYPSTTIDVPLLTAAPPESVPALVDVGRLIGLLTPIDLERMTIVMPESPMSPLGLRAGRYEAVLMPVDRWGSHREHLEQLLRGFLGVDTINADDDGDYPVTTPEGHEMWVRLQTASQPISVQVFSVLASGVDPHPELFEELNAINAAAAHIKVMWAAGAVMAEIDLVAEALDEAELANALQVVRRTAEEYRHVLGAFFGGAAGSGDERTPES